MSFAANNKKNNHSDTEQENNDKKNKIAHKAYSPKNANIKNNNNELISNQDSNTTKNTNSVLLNKDKEISLNSLPIKELNENNLDQLFLPKKKKVFKSPMIITSKMISFQRQKDKTILEFPLFDDEMIFKDINKAYLQDECNDDGDESSDEKINNGKKYLFQEVEQSIKEMKINLKHNQNKHLLSRRMRFKKDKNE
jgi:hypothetical protein